MEPAQEETEAQRLRRIVINAMAIHETHLQVFASSPATAAQAMASLLVSTAQLGPNTYMACLTANLYGQALNYLATNFQEKPPYIEDLRIVIQALLDEGLITLVASGKIGINQDGYKFPAYEIVLLKGAL